MNPFSIRAASRDDCAALAALNVEVQQLHVTHRPDDFKPASAADLSGWFAKIIDDRSANVWIAEAEGMLVGYSVVAVRQTQENVFCTARQWWELDQVAVAAGHRRGGVARALLQRVLSEARAQGVRELELQTWAFNHDAQDAFRRLGFVPKRIRYELPTDADGTAEPPAT